MMRDLIPFLKLFRQHWLFMLIGFVLGLLTLLAGVGLLSLAGWLISAAAFAGLSVTTAAVFNYFLPAAGIRYFALTRIVARYGERLFTHHATFKILADIRVWFYQIIEPLMPYDLSTQRSGDLLNRAINDIDILDNIYIRVLSPFLIALLLTAIIYYFLQFFNTDIAIATLLAMLIAVILIPIFMTILGNKLGQSILFQTNRLRIKMIDLMQGLTEILIYDQDNKYQHEIITTQQKLLKAQFKMAIIKGFAMALVGLIGSITIWFALYIGIPLINLQQLSGANLALIVFTILAAFEAIVPIPIAFQFLGQSKQAASRLIDFSKQQPSVKFNNEMDLTPINYNLCLDQISYRYNENQRVALNHINLNIPFGTKLAVVGPTGAGKSTLASLLVRFIDPSEGVIKLGNIKLTQFSEATLRSLITLVPQKIHFFNASIRDNLLLADDNATDEELLEVLKRVKLDSVINKLARGLNTEMGEFGRRFSGGEGKRFAIARALLRKSPIMVFDEPTEGLDETNQLLIWQIISDLGDRHTVIVISHQLKDPDLLDQVLHLENGRVLN